jgi:post-segregation antitoxin (ccd killing protein)
LASSSSPTFARIIFWSWVICGDLRLASETNNDCQVKFKLIQITISRELVEQARALDLTTWELFAEAIRLAVPGAFELARPRPPRWH